jgi:hypothetical protein
MTISKLIAILTKVQDKHGDIEVRKKDNNEFEGIQVKMFLDVETGEFEEAILTI